MEGIIILKFALVAQQEVGYLLSLHGYRQQNTLQITQFSYPKNNLIFFFVNYFKIKNIFKLKILILFSNIYITLSIDISIFSPMQNMLKRVVYVTEQHTSLQNISSNQLNIFNLLLNNEL